MPGEGTPHHNSATITLMYLSVSFILTVTWQLEQKLLKMYINIFHQCVNAMLIWKKLI
jgi:hypothetical protein